MPMMGVRMKRISPFPKRLRDPALVHCQYKNICIQYLRQLRKTEGGLRDVNTAQAGDPVENLA